MSFRHRGDGALYCYRCDHQQPEGTKQCRMGLLNGKGICGSVAFYRVSRPGGIRADEEPTLLAEAPVHARRTQRSRWKPEGR